MVSPKMGFAYFQIIYRKIQAFQFSSFCKTFVIGCKIISYKNIHLECHKYKLIYTIKNEYQRKHYKDESVLSLKGSNLVEIQVKILRKD